MEDPVVMSVPAAEGGTGAALAKPPVSAPDAAPIAPIAPIRTSRIEAIDGLRALALLMVFGFHAWQLGGNPPLRLRLAGHTISLGAVFASLPAGVDLFMVLSGFCLFWPLCRSAGAADRWGWKDYAWRRIRRIVPPYYAAIVYVTLLPFALFLVYRLLGQEANWPQVQSLWQYVTHVFFIHTLFWITWSGIQPAFWSMGLEVQFYLVFPLVVLGFRRMGIAVVGVMMLASVAYRILTAALWPDAVWQVSFLLSVTFLGRWMEFAAGMTVAWLVSRPRRPKWLESAWGGTALLASAAAACVLALVGRDVHETSLTRDVLLAIGYSAAMVALCATRTPMRVIFENRVATGLGFISYSVFLIHQITIQCVGDVLKRTLHLDAKAYFAALLLLGLPVILTIAFIFFRLFEAPFLSRPKTPVPPRAIAPVPAGAV